MTTVKIDLPDEMAALLAEKASKHGLTLEAWFQKIAEAEAPIGRRRYTLSQLVGQCDANAAMSDEDHEWMDAPAAGREAL